MIMVAIAIVILAIAIMMFEAMIEEVILINYHDQPLSPDLDAAPILNPHPLCPCHTVILNFLTLFNDLLLGRAKTPLAEDTPQPLQSTLIFKDLKIN